MNVLPTRYRHRVIHAAKEVHVSIGEAAFLEGRCANALKLRASQLVQSETRPGSALKASEGGSKSPNTEQGLRGLDVRFGVSHTRQTCQLRADSPQARVQALAL